MMKERHVCLGYDVRSDWKTDPADWSEKRRDLYLINKEVSRPLSTDRSVWPSLFDVLEFSEERTIQENVCQLYDDSNELKDMAQKISKKNKLPWVLIAITLLWETVAKNERGMWSEFLHCLSVKPLNLPETAKWMGFDVSDQAFLSGLTNCGYDRIQKSELIAKWGPHLNEFHLFHHFDQANDFKDFTNGRVKEHAPFYVYGIWMLM